MDILLEQLIFVDIAVNVLDNQAKNKNICIFCRPELF